VKSNTFHKHFPLKLSKEYYEAALFGQGV